MSTTYSYRQCSFDKDLIPLDINYRVEQIASAYPSAYILMSKDVSTIANTGFIIIRTTARRWVISFLKDWMDLRHRPGIFNDQLGFDCLYRQRDKAEMGKRVMILPSHVLNSLQSPIRKQQTSHKVLYLALSM
jgi:hypothetical protein